jgi:hypothetical protein
MLDFCRKSGYFLGTRKRHEISMLSEGRSIILGKSYRMLLQQKQDDPNEQGMTSQGVGNWHSKFSALSIDPEPR